MQCNIEDYCNQQLWINTMKYSDLNWLHCTTTIKKRPQKKEQKKIFKQNKNKQKQANKSKQTFKKKHTRMAPKRSLKIKLSKLSNLCFTTSLHYLVDVCFIRQSAFIYGNTICSSSHRLFPIFVRGRLHTCIQSKQQQKYPLISLSAIKLGEFVDRI